MQFSLEMKGCTIMKNFKRYAAGLAAVMMASSFAACGSSSGTAEDTTTSATTTTGVTVEINTETLASEEQVTMDDVSKLLPMLSLKIRTSSGSLSMILSTLPHQATPRRFLSSFSRRSTAEPLNISPPHGASALPTFPQTFWAVQASTSSQAATLTLSPRVSPTVSLSPTTAMLISIPTFGTQ